MISAGIDCGAKNTKTVIMKEGNIVAAASVPTGFDHGKAVEECLEKALKAAGLSESDLSRIGVTGSGKGSIRRATKVVSEISAMGKGARHFFPYARTVADVGAEDGRAAKLDEKGNAVDFAVNEKCAAGAGAFIEAMARALDTSIEDMGRLALQSQRKIPMNAQCVVFAESEAVGLIHARTEKKDISKAIHDAMASRIVSMIRRIGVNPDVVVLGGVGHNPGLVEAMKRQLGLEKLHVPEEPEYGTAVGAAIVAAEEG
ncbi:MAG: CoA activase [Deltaproteobacteria bacterium]|nr:CoA activase [Deltaproteobacteria bacterium]